MIKKIILFAVLIACMASIFFFSSQNAESSGNLSHGVTYYISRIFVPDFSEMSEDKQLEIIQHLHHYIRKAAHFSIYFILGVAAFLNSKEYIGKKGTAAIVSSLFCLAYAASDEYHQTFTSGRCGSPTDVFIDFSGALTGTFFIICLIKIFQKIKSKTKKPVN